VKRERLNLRTSIVYGGKPHQFCRSTQLLKTNISFLRKLLPKNHGLFSERVRLVRHEWRMFRRDARIDWREHFGGVDPRGPFNGIFRALRGGSIPAGCLQGQRLSKTTPSMDWTRSSLFHRACCNPSRRRRRCLSSPWSIA
jgi:hypothetical protein